MSRKLEVEIKIMFSRYCAFRNATEEEEQNKWKREEGVQYSIQKSGLFCSSGEIYAIE